MDKKHNFFVLIILLFEVSFAFFTAHEIGKLFYVHFEAQQFKSDFDYSPKKWILFSN